MKILGVIQSRCGSARLPGKVMLPLEGKEVLVRLVERVQRSALLNHIVVATTTAFEDDVIQNLCAREELACFRGHPADLLDRHYRAGLEFGADAIAKIPSDCPLIDPGIIDHVIAFFRMNHSSFDFVSNLHPPSYPDGNDVEIIPMQILEQAWKRAKKAFEREHTTPFIWDNPETFRIGNVRWETGRDYSVSHRWVLDYWEDYQFIKQVYEELYHGKPAFSMEDILHLLEEKPHIGEINKRYAGVNWYGHHIKELKTICAAKSTEKAAV